MQHSSTLCLAFGVVTDMTLSVFCPETPRSGVPQEIGLSQVRSVCLVLLRKLNKEVEGGKQKPGGGIWGYIAGTPAT